MKGDAVRFFSDEPEEENEEPNSFEAHGVRRCRSCAKLFPVELPACPYCDALVPVLVTSPE